MTAHNQTAAPMVTIIVSIEWPTGSEAVEFEIEADATDEEITGAAAEAFFNLCNYGWSRKQ